MEKLNLEKFQKHSFDNRNEILNANDISVNSKIFIVIEKISYLTDLEKKISGIYIRLIHENDVKRTSLLVNDICNENFEL